MITDTALPLGTTPAGSAWSTKALHPSDHEMPMSGIPDRKSRPTATLHFDVKYKISNPTPVGADTTWNCDVLLRPDPLSFGSFVRTSASEYAEPITRKETMTTGVPRYFLNTQVSGTGGTPEAAYDAKYAFWRANVREFRLMYAGATVVHDGPALSDQGTITAAQYPVFDKDYSIAAVDYTAPANSYATRKIAVWESTFPTFDSLQNMPGVFVGKAKEGCYMPFKLDLGDLDFRSVGQATYSHSDLTSGAVSDGPLYVSAPTGHSHPTSPVADVSIADATGVVTGNQLLPASSRNIGHIAVRGVSNSAALYVQLRVGYEITVMPGSTYSPNLVKLADSDEVALKSYFEISRRLQDAYPENYNSLGAILPIIGSIASRILPTLAPIAGKALRGLGNMISDSGLSEEEAQAKQTRRKAKKQVLAAYKRGQQQLQ